MVGSLSCPANQGGIMDDLSSMSFLSAGGDGGRDDDSSVDSSWLSADPASSDDAGPVDLYDMSSLMAQLPPLRRGLSRFYDGKSQSFGSLGSVKAVEDLPEPGRRRSGRKKQVIANMHGSSNLSKVIRKMRPSRSPDGVSFMVCSAAKRAI